MAIRNVINYGLALGASLKAAELVKRASAPRRASSIPMGLGGLVLGLAAGACAGLLLAPRSGAHTREMLSRRVSSLADDVKAAAERLEDKLVHAQRAATNTAQEALPSSA